MPFGFIPLASTSSCTLPPALFADSACRHVIPYAVADSVYAGPPLRTPQPALSAHSAGLRVIPYAAASTFGRYRLPRGFPKRRRRFCVCRRRLCAHRCRLYVRCRPHYRPISLAATSPRTPSPALFADSACRQVSPNVAVDSAYAAARTFGRFRWPPLHPVRRRKHFRPIPLAARFPQTSPSILRMPGRLCVRRCQHFWPIPLAAASSRTPLPALSSHSACREVSPNVAVDSAYAVTVSAYVGTVSAYAVARTIGRFRLPPRHSARHCQHYRPISLAATSPRTPSPALSADTAGHHVIPHVTASTIVPFRLPPRRPIRRRQHFWSIPLAATSFRTSSPALLVDSAGRRVIPHVTASTIGRFRLPRGFPKRRRLLCARRGRRSVRCCPHYRPISLAATSSHTPLPALSADTAGREVSPNVAVDSAYAAADSVYAGPPLRTPLPALSADIACRDFIPYAVASTFGRFRWPPRHSARRRQHYRPIPLAARFPKTSSPTLCTTGRLCVRRRRLCVCRHFIPYAVASTFGRYACLHVIPYAAANTIGPFRWPPRHPARRRQHYRPISLAARFPQTSPSILRMPPPTVCTSSPPLRTPGPSLRALPPALSADIACLHVAPYAVASTFVPFRLPPRRPVRRRQHYRPRPLAGRLRGGEGKVVRRMKGSGGDGLWGGGRGKGWKCRNNCLYLCINTSL